ncbi:MAG: hypothetical protein LBF58_01770, partial [Deltaproteobacteria bacterium]|nr:hypothetical protein [Deltaproteobacteria bacterium]
MKSLYSLGLAGLMVLFGLNWTAQAWAVDANGTYQDTQTYTEGINENLTIDDGATATETGPITGEATANYTVTGKGTLNLRNDTNSDFTGGITFTSGNINVLKRTNLINQMSKFIFNSANTVATAVTDALALFKVYQTDANKATVLNTLSAIDYSLATLSLGTATEKAEISFDNQLLGTTQSLTIVNSFAGRIHLSKESTLTLENMIYTTTSPTTTTGGIIVNRYGFLALTGDEGSLYTIQNNSSSFQSAFYNYGTLFISDVLIQNNVSTRSSTSYNLATLIFLGEATYKNNLTRNYAQVGGIYNSTGGTIYFFGPADFTGNGYLDHTPTSSSTMNPGVFYNSNQGTIDFFDVAQFVENQGFQGGAIYSLTNSNSAQTYAIFFHGKATFDKNKAGNDNRAGSGGGIYLLGGTIKFDDGVVFNENKAFDGTSTNNKSGFGGGIFLDWGSGRATSIVEISGDFEFTKNVAGVSGGAMHLGNNSRLDIKLTGGKEGLFSGNVAADQANSLHFELTTNRTSTFALTIADNAYLRMHDPMTGIIGANSTLTIEMTGQGRWDLGGQSTFGSEGSTIISINGGTLYLYRQGETKDVSDNVVAAGKINLAATTTPTSSAFTLASGATLGIGGGNAIVTENGRIYIDVGSTLAFNLNGYDTTASVPMLLLDGDVFITDTGTTGGKIGLDLSSLP